MHRATFDRTLLRILQKFAPEVAGQLSSRTSTMQVELVLYLHNDPYTDLYVELIDTGTVAVHHVREQNGDLMFVPEIVFKIVDGMKGPEFHLVEFTDHSLGIYRRKFFSRGGKEYVNLAFDQHLAGFLTLWGRNIAAQGWMEATVDKMSKVRRLDRRAA